jgi:hypothetical protein
MSTKFILKNKSTQEINNTTGSLAELFIDTSKHSLVVMDGETSGGVPLALESFVTANSLPDKSSAENNYLTINNNGEPEWVNVDLSLLPIGTVIDSFNDLPSEYFLKFDGTLRSTEDYPEFTNIYTNESVLAIPTVENSPSNFFNRTAYTEVWKGLFATGDDIGRDLNLPRSTDNMVFDGTYYVRILGQEDLNYNKTLITDYSTRYYYPVISTSSSGIPSNMLVTYNVTQPPPQITPITLSHILSSNTESYSSFGRSVATSGNYAIVGHPFKDDASGINSGKAYIFNVTTGDLVHTLDNPNAFGTAEGDAFGEKVAISGNYAVVAAQSEDDAGGTNSGKAYIFNVTTGALVHTLDNPNAFGTSENDFFGRSVAISGNYVIIGASLEDDAGGILSGKAYIFNVTTGALVHTLDNPNPDADRRFNGFGGSVAISGNYAVVGAQGTVNLSAPGNSGTSSGKAYIFNVTTGALVHTLNNPNAFGTEFADNFGEKVAISGNYIIIGTRQEDESGFGESGKAYIFNVTTGALVHTLDNPNAFGDPTADRFGSDVAISGDYAIVGTIFPQFGQPYGEDDAGGTDSGKAYIFNVTTGQLVRVLHNPNAFGTSQNDYFSASVAISDSVIIVSAIGESDVVGTPSAGIAYIYNIEPSVTPTRLDLSSVAGVPQYWPPDYGSEGENFEEAYWETSNGSHRIVIRINMTDIASETWGNLGLFDNNPFTWRTEEQWAIDEQLYNDAQNEFPPNNSYDYLRPLISVKYEGQSNSETNVILPRTWENPLVTVFNIGSVTPPDGTQFKIQRSLDGINWTTFTVAPFSNNATRCYSVLADEDDGKIYMVAQALPNFNPYNPLTITEADGTSDVVVMSSDHGSTWVEIAAPYRNTGRVLTYNNITKSLYLFNGTKLTPFNAVATEEPPAPKVTVANTEDITIQFNPVQLLDDNESYSPYSSFDLSNYFTNYTTVKNDVLMYIQAYPAQANQGGNFETIANGEYIEREHEHYFKCGQQISLLGDSVLWQEISQPIQSFYGNDGGFFPEADKNKFKNEICFCEVPTTFSNTGAIVTPDRIYGIFKHKNSSYKIYVQKDFVTEQGDPYGFTFYADVELPEFSVYNEILNETGLDSAVEQKGISKFHWSPLFGFMVFTKNKIYYNLDPINNKLWNKINGLNESKNYQFLTCINTPDGVLVSGMNDVIYVTIPDNKFLLPIADTNLLNKYQTSKYIKIK